MNNIIVQKIIAVIDSVYKHSNQYEKVYVAKLTPSSQDKYEFSREFLPRRDILLKDNTFTFKWDILETGIYEIREEYLNYTTKTSYFAINNNGDQIVLAEKLKAKRLVLKNNWEKLSPLKIQILGLSGPTK